MMLTVKKQAHSDKTARPLINMTDTAQKQEALKKLKAVIIHTTAMAQKREAIKQQAQPPHNMINAELKLALIKQIQTV